MRLTRDGELVVLQPGRRVLHPVRAPVQVAAGLLARSRRKEERDAGAQGQPEEERAGAPLGLLDHHVWFVFVEMILTHRPYLAPRSACTSSRDGLSVHRDFPPFAFALPFAGGLGAGVRG